MNITINATQLFTAVSHPSDNYQFKVTENSSESGSFDTTLSNTSFINMTNNTDRGPNVVELDWRNVNDECLIDLNITVPSAELAASRTSTITFTVTSSTVS